MLAIYQVNMFMALYKGYNTVGNKSTKTRLEDGDLIKRDLMNHFNIRKGEKLMNIQFGTIIWDVLFEPLTDDLRDAIVEDVTEIVKYDPRINAESILVDEYEHGILVEVSIRYNNNSQVESMRFMFDQNQNSVAYSAA
jgi:phage baseplate assembly protein W